MIRALATAGVLVLLYVIYIWRAERKRARRDNLRHITGSARWWGHR